MGIDKFISVNKLDSANIGHVDANKTVIKNASTPIDNNDLTTKKYVDDLFDKVDTKKDFASKSGNIITLENDGINYLGINANQICMVAQEGGGRSEFVLGKGGVFINSSEAVIGSNTNGTDFCFSTGNGDGVGNGGNFTVSLGVGGKEGKQGIFTIHGPINLGGVVQMLACPDPGTPPHQSIYLWLDRDTGVLKVRKPNGDELVLI